MLPTRGLNAQDGVPDRVLERLLERHAPRRLERPVLEAGTDKFTLQAMIEARGWRWIGVHHAARVADEAHPLASQVEVQADLRRLPFGDDAFDLVLSRALQRPWEDDHSYALLVSELVRTSRGLIVAAWWDGEALRPRMPWPRHTARRRGLQRAALRELFEDAGASVVEWRHSFRFVSQNAWLVARKRAAVQRPVIQRPLLQAALPHTRLGPLGA